MPTLFKKTDSVLRGQVHSEIRAVQEMLGIPAALLVPQNPSKGRTIVNGRYLIDGVPLEQTSFRHDPEYPRTTADVTFLLGAATDASDVCIGDLPDGVSVKGITVGNAASEDDMRMWAAVGTRGNHLLAGGADFFRALLTLHGHAFAPGPLLSIPAGKMLVVCGSAAANSRELIERWHCRGLPICPMPERHEEPDCATSWARAAEMQLHGPQGRSILCIRHSISPERAAGYRRCMAETVRQLVDRMEQDLALIIEGGATSAAIRAALGCEEFEVYGNLAPGVVVMQSHRNGRRLQIVLKPGSYPWPAEFLERIGHAAH